MNADANWTSANQFSLVSELENLKQLLRRRAENVPPETNQSSAPPDPENQTLKPSALDMLCAAFSLSSFERSILLLCAGIELDSAFAPLWAAAQGDPSRPFPTFSLALAALPDPHWSALAPEAPLRRWRLIEIAPAPALTVSPLRIDERVLHYLAGIAFLDERLAALAEPIMSAVATDLAPSHEAIVINVVAALTASRQRQRLPAVQLCAAGVFDCGKARIHRVRRDAGDLHHAHVQPPRVCPRRNPKFSKPDLSEPGIVDRGRRFGSRC